MTHPTATSEEFRELLAAAAEGRVTPAQSATLNAMLADDADARATYLDYMSIDAMLRWMRHVPPAATLGGAASDAVRGRSMRIGGAAAERPGRSTRLIAWAAAAALVLGASAWVARVALKPGGAPPAPSAPVTSAAPVAVLTDGAGFVTIHRSDPGGEGVDEAAFAAAGQELRPGLISVARGTAELSFGSGATARVEGPAAVRLISTTRARLEYGRLAAYVPPPAHGFTIDAGPYRVVDLGTSFALSADAGGEVELHVFDGQVEIGGKGRVRVLGRGEAVVGLATGDLREVALDRAGFGELMQALAEVGDDGPPVTDGLALWLAADRGYELDESGGAGAWRAVAGPASRGARQPIAERRPAWVASGIAGRPVMRFSGDDFMQLPTTAALGLVGSDYEMLVVARTDSPDVQFLIAGSYDVGIEQFELHVGGPLGVRFIPRHHAERDAGASPLDSYADLGGENQYVGAAHLFEARVEGSVGIVGVDGVASDDTVADARSMHRGELTVGMRGVAAYPFKGDIAEVLIFDRALSARERASVRQYLTKKYSLPESPERSDGPAIESRSEATE